jgi:glycosyltransferase involved in cell wall biosynthesis
MAGKTGRDKKELFMERSLPLVSVIIPVFNCLDYLKEAIESVLSQTCLSFEVIVVDDGSTDGSGEVARSFGHRIRYFQQVNSGASAARNFGVRQAAGAYIAFLDADDIWTPDKLSMQMDWLTEHPETGYVTAKVRHFLEPGFAVPQGFREQLLTSGSNAPLLSTLVVRRPVFEAVGGFDPALPISEDIDWFSRAADMNISMVLIDKVLLQKRVHGNNISLCHRSNNRELLLALRDSIRRKRNSIASAGGDTSD